MRLLKNILSEKYRQFGSSNSNINNKWLDVTCDRTNSAFPCNFGVIPSGCINWAIKQICVQASWSYFYDGPSKKPFPNPDKTNVKSKQLDSARVLHL